MVEIPINGVCFGIPIRPFIEEGRILLHRFLRVTAIPLLLSDADNLLRRFPPPRAAVPPPLTAEPNPAEGEAT